MPEYGTLKVKVSNSQSSPPVATASRDPLNGFSPGSVSITPVVTPPTIILTKMDNVISDSASGTEIYKPGWTTLGYIYAGPQDEVVAWGAWRTTDYSGYSTIQRGDASWHPSDDFTASDGWTIVETGPIDTSQLPPSHAAVYSGVHFFLARQNGADWNGVVKANWEAFGSLGFVIARNLAEGFTFSYEKHYNSDTERYVGQFDTASAISVLATIGTQDRVSDGHYPLACGGEIWNPNHWTDDFWNLWSLGIEIKFSGFSPLTNMDVYNLVPGTKPPTKLEVTDLEVSASATQRLGSASPDLGWIFRQGINLSNKGFYTSSQIDDMPGVEAWILPSGEWVRSRVTQTNDDFDYAQAVYASVMASSPAPAELTLNVGPVGNPIETVTIEVSELGFYTFPITALTDANCLSTDLTFTSSGGTISIAVVQLVLSWPYGSAFFSEPLSPQSSRELTNNDLEYGERVVYSFSKSQEHSGQRPWPTYDAVDAVLPDTPAGYTSIQRNVAGWTANSPWAPRFYTYNYGGLGSIPPRQTITLDHELRLTMYDYRTYLGGSLAGAHEVAENADADGWIVYDDSDGTNPVEASGSNRPLATINPGENSVAVHQIDITAPSWEFRAQASSNNQAADGSSIESMCRVSAWIPVPQALDTQGLSVSEAFEQKKIRLTDNAYQQSGHTGASMSWGGHDDLPNLGSSLEYGPKSFSFTSDALPFGPGILPICVGPEPTDALLPRLAGGMPLYYSHTQLWQYADFDWTEPSYDSSITVHLAAKPTRVYYESDGWRGLNDDNIVIEQPTQFSPWKKAGVPNPGGGALNIKMVVGEGSPPLAITPPPGHLTSCGSMPLSVYHSPQSQFGTADGIFVIRDTQIEPGEHTLKLRAVWDAYGGMVAPQRLWLHNADIGLQPGQFYYDITTADEVFITDGFTVTLTEANKTQLPFDGWTIYYRVGNPNDAFPPPQPPVDIDFDNEFIWLPIAGSGSCGLILSSMSSFWADDQGSSGGTWRLPGYAGAEFGDIAITIRAERTGTAPSGKSWMVVCGSWDSGTIDIPAGDYTIGDPLPPVIVPGSAITQAMADGEATMSWWVEGNYNQDVYWDWRGDQDPISLNWSPYSSGGGEANPPQEIHSWHTCDNREPPPDDGNWGNTPVANDWGHASWLRPKGEPGSGRTGRLNVVLRSVVTGNPPSGPYDPGDDLSGTDFAVVTYNMPGWVPNKNSELSSLMSKSSVIGFQEALHLKDNFSSFPNWTLYCPEIPGDDYSGGVAQPIGFNNSVWSLVNSGYHFLNDTTPIQPAAAGPTNHKSKHIIWVQLQNVVTNDIITFGNCHFVPSNHLGGAALALWEQQRDNAITWLNGLTNVVLMGDFNDQPHENTFAPFVSAVADVLTDPAGTRGDRSIDILLSKGVTANGAKALGGFGSDHKPVRATYS